MQMLQLFWVKSLPAGGGQTLLLQQSGLFNKLTAHGAMKTLSFSDSDHPELSQDPR